MKNIGKILIGSAKNPHDVGIFHKLSLIAFLAWIGLGADGLSSSCYGPEEAFLALGNHPYLGIFVALASGLTIFIIATSYSQIIELFPSGGGGYLVRVLDEYDRIVDEFGLEVVNAVGSITDQQRSVRSLISRHLQVTDTEIPDDEPLTL